MTAFKENLHTDLLIVRKLLLDHYDKYYSAVIKQADAMEQSNISYHIKDIVHDLNAYVFDDFCSAAVVKLDKLKEKD